MVRGTATSVADLPEVLPIFPLSGVLLLIIVKPSDPSEVLNEPAVEAGLTS